jgi:hypothetical protein
LLKEVEDDEKRKEMLVAMMIWKKKIIKILKMVKN